MKKTAYFLLFICISNIAYSQDLQQFKDFFNGTIALNNIQQITTVNDFDQQILSSDQVDDKIKELIKQPLVAETEIPINFKKLVYLGNQEPIKYFHLDSVTAVKVTPLLNKPLEIYIFDGVYIINTQQDAKSLLNVFFTARALEIIKFRYPEIYKYLIFPDQIVLGLNKLIITPQTVVPVLSKLKPIISFDSAPKVIASSSFNKTFAQTPTVPFNGGLLYENTLNAITELDYTRPRPAEIYGSRDSLENYFKYLKEGLIESITHEFTHHYISNFGNFELKAGYVFNKRFDANDRNFQNTAEELIVINTTESYFIKHGRLSKQLTDFNMEKRYMVLSKPLRDTSNAQYAQYFNELLSRTPNASQQKLTFDQVYIFDIYKKE